MKKIYISRNAANKRIIKLGFTILSEDEDRTLQCSNVHTFETSVFDILVREVCPTCVPKISCNIDIIRRAVKLLGGICISQECNRTTDVVECKCRKGHPVRTTANQILRGHWCSNRECKYERTQRRQSARVLAL